MTSDDFTLIDATGVPIAAVNLPKIIAAGTQLAFDAAAHSDDPEHLKLLFTGIMQAGPGAYGYVCAAALDVLVQQILQPALEVAAAHGNDLRPMLYEIAATKPDRDEQ